MRSVAQQEKMPTAHPFQPPRSAHELRRRAGNIVAVLFTGIAIAFAVIILLYLLFYVLLVSAFGFAATHAVRLMEQSLQVSGK